MFAISVVYLMLVPTRTNHPNRYTGAVHRRMIVKRCCNKRRSSTLDTGHDIFIHSRQSPTLILGDKTTYDHLWTCIAASQISTFRISQRIDKSQNKCIFPFHPKLPEIPCPSTPCRRSDVVRSQRTDWRRAFSSRQEPLMLRTHAASSDGRPVGDDRLARRSSKD